MIRNGHFQFIRHLAEEYTSDVAAKMYRVVLLILILSRVNPEMRSLKQSAYVSRKSRANSIPLASGYVYSQVNNNPGTLAMFGTDAGDYNSHAHGQYSDFPLNKITKYSSHEEVPVKEMISPYTAPPVPSYEYLKAKAETKYETSFLPSKVKSDLMYEKLKSLMHYKYPDDGLMTDVNYNTLNDYPADDDDVRTSSRTFLSSWPYFLHNSYESDAMNRNYDTENAKDKRYIVDYDQDVIPVHENVDETPNYYNYNQHDTSTSRYKQTYGEVSTDNPMYGDQPFFSFVLNDYFDRSNEDDSLTFKGLHWGKDFDREPPVTDVQEYMKRNRRLGEINSGNDRNKASQSYDMSNHAADSTTERGYNKKHEFDKHEKADKQNENHKSAYANSGNNYRGLKDFVDTFTNKFGGEEHKKDAKYILSKNQDKGEKRKGFRRVYHKDEYQEEDEFYDNSNKSAKAEEKGGSSMHHGGSQGVLKSHAAAAIGNEANAFNNVGNAEKNRFENNHKGHALDKGYNGEFNRYRDIAKKAAQSNSADYVDNNYRYRP